MKKKYKIIAFLLLGCIGAYAQPVLNATDFTSESYTADTYYSDGITGLSPGSSGANQVWNFSSLDLILGGTSGIVPVALTPYAGSFPTANFCFKTTIIGLPDSFFEYFKISSSNLENLGRANSFGIETYSDTSVLFKFPYTYNTVFSDTYQYTGNPQINTHTITYDSYGTIMTPFETFTNVIRQKTVDSATGTTYLWFKSNPFRLIMSWSSSDNGVTGSMSVWRYTGLGLIKNNRDKRVEIYPNPANSMLNLQLPNSLIVDKVVITDLTGKTVLQQNQNTNQINVQNLTSGLYMLQVFSGEEKFQSKFVKE